MKKKMEFGLKRKDDDDDDDDDYDDERIIGKYQEPQHRNANYDYSMRCHSIYPSIRLLIAIFDATHVTNIVFYLSLAHKE